MKLWISEQAFTHEHTALAAEAYRAIDDPVGAFSGWPVPREWDNNLDYERGVSLPENAPQLKASKAAQTRRAQPGARAPGLNPYRTRRA